MAPARHRRQGAAQYIRVSPARLNAPDLRDQAFSTCPNSSSTGVERPKISTATRRRLFS